MKTRDLPPTDLARIAPLPTDEKVRQLRRFKLGLPPFTYAPVRKALPDILEVSGSLFGTLGPTPLVEIETQIRRAKTSLDGIEQNLIVARTLHQFACDNKIKAFERPFYSMTIGMLDQIRLWPDLYLVMEGRAWIPFIDTRRGNGLTEVARKFVFSLQHEHIRALDFDMRDAGLCVLQFPPEGKERVARVYRHEASALFTYEQLETMIDETYRLWMSISEERTEERRRAGVGSGSLL